MEDLLLAEGIATEMAYDSRFDGLSTRVDDIHKDLRSIEKRLPPNDFPFTALAQLAAQKQDNFFRRHAYVLTPITTVGLFIISFLLGLFNSTIDGRISAKLDGPQHGLNARVQKLSEDFAKANGELKTIRKLWENSLNKIGKLKPQQFQKILPQTADVLKAASVLKINIPSEVKHSIRQNFLEVNTNAPSYWSAVSQFINYRSRSENDLPSDLRTILAYESKEGLFRCYDDPHPSGLSPNETHPIQGPFIFWACVIDLDKPTEGLLKLLVDRRQISLSDAQFVFHRCIVRYSGGQLNPLLARAVFEDCAFMFLIESAPPPPGQQLIRTVLESQGSSVKIPS